MGLWQWCPSPQLFYLEQLVPWYTTWF
jgi:hypothetical protein